MAEAWAATFKAELVDGRRFGSFEQAEHETLAWIGFYNEQRLQGSSATSHPPSTNGPSTTSTGPPGRSRQASQRSRRAHWPASME